MLLFSFARGASTRLQAQAWGAPTKLAAALPPFLSLHTTNGRLPTQTLASETQGSLEKDLVCVPLVLDRIGGFITFGKPEGT